MVAFDLAYLIKYSRNILTLILEIRFEMFKTTPLASEAYLPTLLFAHASFMLSSIFNILNTNTVFPLRFWRSVLLLQIFKVRSYII